MSNMDVIYIKCPSCNKTVKWSKESRYRPFCSKRCQLIDLGSWANEENYIPSGQSDSHNLSNNHLPPFDKEEDN